MYSFTQTMVADDRILPSLFENELQHRIDTCFLYSRRWRYQYSPAECGFIDFTEITNVGTKAIRIWLSNVFDKTAMYEAGTYTHLSMTLFQNVDSPENLIFH